MSHKIRRFSEYEEEHRKAWEQCIAEMPEEIQKIAKTFPPGPYVIKPGAPYGVACPGTLVEIYSYLQSGMVSVVVWAENKLPAAIEHEKWLGKKAGKSKAEIERFHEGNVLLEVDPAWLDHIN